MNSVSDVIIIGGGLAGLTAAIHLSKAGRKILLIEKNEFPKHKVCGEYLSNEVVPYLDFLGINLQQLHPVNITKTSISTISGRQIDGRLPSGGFGVSRYALDNLLYHKALANGSTVKKESVTEIVFENDSFTITTDSNSYQSAMVIGAFGKRSNIDQKLHRKFIFKKSPWLAVKAHYSGDFPNDLVALHNFKGGYCGVSKVENDTINICYLADYDTFKKHRNIDDYQKNILCKNPQLKKVFENATMIFDKPVTIGQISFERKQAVENHILMVGDTAGLIHPLCGNGMAMAIHSAKIASELLLDYFGGKIVSREKLENQYSLAWKHHFQKRMRTGKFLALVLRHETTAAFLMNWLMWFPSLLPRIVKMTHGKPLTIQY